MTKEYIKYCMPSAKPDQYYIETVKKGKEYILTVYSWDLYKAMSLVFTRCKTQVINDLSVPCKLLITAK